MSSCCDLFHDPVCDPIQSNPAFLNARNHSVPFPPLFLKTLSKECFDHFNNFSYCMCINLPTLISNFDRRDRAFILTRYTSVTNSSCPRSTLHHGKLECAPNVHDPSAKVILLFPSTALSLVPPLTVYECWYVGFWNARFSGRKCPHKKKEMFPWTKMITVYILIIEWQLYWVLRSCIEYVCYTLHYREKLKERVVLKNWLMVDITFWIAYRYTSLCQKAGKKKTPNCNNFDVGKKSCTGIVVNF